MTRTVVAAIVALALAAPASAQVFSGGSSSPAFTQAQQAASAANLFPPGASALFIFDNTGFDNQRSGVEVVAHVSSIVQETSTVVGFTSSISSSNATTGRPAVVRTTNGGVLSNTVLGNCAAFTNQTDPALKAFTAPGRYELLVLLRQQSEHAGDVIMNGATSGADTGFRLKYDASAGGYHWAVSNSAILITDLAMPAGYTRALRRHWGVISAHSNTTTATLEAWTGGAQVATVSAATGASTSVAPIHQTTVGAAFDCSAPYDSQIGAIAMFPRELTNAERATAISAMYVAAGVPVADVPSILFVGDSTMEGNSEGPTVWQQLQAMLPRSRITQRALSGARLVTISAALTDELTIAAPNVIVVEGGLNDIFDGTASATVNAALEAVVVAAKASGAKVIVQTVTPGTDATKTTAVNALIRLYPTSEADAVLDMSALLSDPAIGAGNWNLAYDFDTLHPNALGNRTYAQGLYQIITSKGWISP